MKRLIPTAVLAVTAFGASAAAQTATAPAMSVAKPAPVAAGGVAPAVSPAVKPKPAQNCFRLPLSDVAFGTEGATNAARVKLDEYADAEMKKRKWPAKPLAKSNETVSCEVYLNFGPLGTEYRCLVTTTFCQK